jgi:hypothetical protein
MDRDLVTGREMLYRLFLFDPLREYASAKPKWQRREPIMITSLGSRRLDRLSWAELNEQRCDLLSAALGCRKPAEVRGYVDRIEVLNGEVRRRSAGYRRRVKG